MQPGRILAIGGILRRLALGERARIARLGRPHLVQGLQALRAVGGRSGEPACDHVGAIEPARRSPSRIGRRDPLQRAAIEGVVRTGGAQRLLDVAIGHVHRAAQLRLDPRAQRRHRVGRTRALTKKTLRPFLAHPPAERLHVADQREVAAPLRFDQHLGERRIGERLFLALFERTKAGHQPRLGREAGQQRLAEGVDRLDAQPAAGRLEHAREQGARVGAGFRRDVLAQSGEFLGERAVLHPHPARQPRVDAVGHLGGARLGEGEAENRGGIVAREQQPDHARGQHMRLAGAGRRRQPDEPPRIGRVGLRAFERAERRRAAAHSGSSSGARSCRPYHSSSRISWS